MPTFPVIEETSTYKQVVDTFGGYNHNLKIGNGEFYDMKNMTSSYYPILSPRGKRGVLASPTSPQGLVAKDALCYVDGTNFVINNSTVNMNLSTAAADCPKTLVSMGAYVIILPDKKYINTKDLTDFGNIEATVTTTTNVTYSMCNIEGAEYSGVTASSVAPDSPENMQYWIDTSTTPHVLKQWSATSSMWVSIVTTYVKISATGIGSSFEQYDGITISGVAPAQLSDLNGTVVLWAKGADYLVVTGIIDAVQTQTSAITVSRLMPYMDYVIESDNRLWGCRYGTARNGDIVNEIYACKLGDFRNWNCFMGISTDSYAASCGSDGQFTGAATHLGYPIFFKENCLHKVYGSYPSQYQVQTTVCRGVEKGSDRSLAIVNEVLYYKAATGVCAYDGSLPVEMSTSLGETRYSNAVAGGCGNKYYISMKDANNAWNLFVYDASRGMWHREDNTHATAFCSCRGDIYFIDASDNKIYSELGSGTLVASPVEWEAQTGIVGIVESSKYGSRLAERKYISRIVLRMDLEAGSSASVYIQYDSVGSWEHICTMNTKNMRSFSIPVLPRRCDHFRLKLKGKGDTKIYSFVSDIEEGSDKT